MATLVSFNLTNGSNPTAGLIADANGDLFGTTFDGGANNDGTVFEIVKTASGYASTLTTLVSFNGANGYGPADLIADANGDLFGTTFGGGVNSLGTLFEIIKTASGYASAPSSLVSFNEVSGLGVHGGLIADANGNLFGTAAQGGANFEGTVFEIIKTASGYASTPTTLVSFNGVNGNVPEAGLIADVTGNLFGTTSQGGTNNDGTVFEVVKTASGYASTPTTLVNFNAANGAFPLAGLMADANGDLFGTTWQGGTNNDGTVFEIVKTASGYSSTPTTLVNFNGVNGASPQAGLIVDANGDLFGTTYAGGNNNGTVFEIVKTASGYASTLTTLLSFNGTNGSGPDAGLIADADGNLFGTTVNGGANGAGTVFEIINSGFVTLAITGTVANQQACLFGLVHPFSGVAINDLASGQTETVAITASSANSLFAGYGLNGILIDPHAGSDSSHYVNGVFTVTGTPTAVATDLHALEFVAGFGTTNFSIKVTDSSGHTVTDHTTSVVGLSLGSTFHF